MRLTPNNKQIISEYVSVRVYMIMLKIGNINFYDNMFNRSRINLWKQKKECSYEEYTNYFMSGKMEYFIPDNIELDKAIEFQDYDIGAMNKCFFSEKIIINLGDLSNDEYGVDQDIKPRITCPNCGERHGCEKHLDLLVIPFYFHPEGYYTSGIENYFDYPMNNKEEIKIKYVKELKDPKYPYKDESYIYALNDFLIEDSYCILCFDSEVSDKFKDMFVTEKNVIEKELKQNIFDWMPLKYEYIFFGEFDQRYIDILICLNKNNQYYGHIMWQFYSKRGDEKYYYYMGFKNYNDLQLYLKYVKN